MFDREYWQGLLATLTIVLGADYLTETARLLLYWAIQQITGNPS